MRYKDRSENSPKYCSAECLIEMRFISKITKDIIIWGSNSFLVFKLVNLINQIHFLIIEYSTKLNVILCSKNKNRFISFTKQTTPTNDPRKISWHGNFQKKNTKISMQGFISTFFYWYFFFWMLRFSLRHLVNTPMTLKVPQ